MGRAHRNWEGRSVCGDRVADRLGVGGSSGSGEGEGYDEGANHEGLHWVVLLGNFSALGKDFSGLPDVISLGSTMG